jgi:hypothetical protein
MAQISRDPFARTTLMRTTVTTSATCSWCGSTRRTGKLFCYATERDGLRNTIKNHRGLFCSKSCHDAYHS